MPSFMFFRSSIQSISSLHFGGSGGGGAVSSFVSSFVSFSSAAEERSNVLLCSASCAFDNDIDKATESKFC